MDKKKLDNAAEVKKDEALKESFAEIKKAAAVDKTKEAPKAEAKKEEKKAEKAAEKTETAAEPKKRGRKPAAAKVEKKESAKAVKAEKAEKAETKKRGRKPGSTKTADPAMTITLEFNGKQFNVEEVRKQALKAAKKAKKDAKKVDIYVVANQSAAYYVVDGEGKDEYRINL